MAAFYSLSSLPKSNPYGMAQVREQESGKFMVKWELLSTPLGKYASCKAFPPTPPRFDFQAYLERKLLDARKSNQMLKVLDVGVGTGGQWASIARQYQSTLDISFTVYENIDAVHSIFRERTVTCAASEIASIFPHGKFDIVVTHYGAHYQLTELLVAANSLLVPGGEAILSGDGELRWVSTDKGRVWAYEYILGKCKEYALLAVDPPNYEAETTHWFLHLKKN
ncbi:MAG: class I SAM-dependent methyltransferase [Candidatus Micrarchaeota archaeon]|nr:class I SAM-dependent methyltransferase [Candidatus Micrarchaeota archaeon]